MRTRLTLSRSTYAKAVRDAQQSDQDMRDAQVSEQLLKNPSKLHQAIRKEKSASSSISTLNVGSRTFTGNNVCDGFFDSLSNLKEPDMSHIANSSSFAETLRDYNRIMELASSGAAIPAIEPHESVELL